MRAGTLQQRIKRMRRYNLCRLNVGSQECKVVCFLRVGWGVRSVARYLQMSCHEVHRLAEGFLRRI